MADTYSVDIRIDATNGPAITKIGQVETKLKSVEGAARQGFGGANRETGQFTRGVGNAQAAIIGFGAAMVSQIGIQSIGQLRAMGAEMDLTYSRFEALAGGPQLASAAMDDLREKTGGVIGDMQLTRDAVSMLMTGVADDVGEAGDIIKLGLQLAGQEGGAVLAQALKNQSIELLDSVGISAADVRALSQQYRDMGLDASAAFTRATLEIGAGVVESLGDAADAGITEWDRMVAHINNTVLGPAGFVNDLGEEIGRTYNNAVRTVELMQQIEEMNQVRTGMDTGQALIAMLTGARVASDQADGGAMRRVFQWKLGDLTEQITSSAFASAFDTVQNLPALAASFPQRQIEATRPIYDAATQLLADSQLAIGNRVGAPVFEGVMTPAMGMQAGDMSALVERAQEIRDTMQQASDAGLITPAHMAGIQNYLNYVETIAGEAELAADAYDRITGSLDGLLGVNVTNGTGTQITDAVAQGMRDAGMSDEQIDAYIDAMDLSTGRQTELSQRFESEVIPGIAGVFEQYGTDAATEASLAFQRGLTLWQTNGWGNPDNLLGLSGFMRGDDGSLVSTGVGQVPDNVGAGGITPLGGMGAPESPFGQLLTEGDAVIAKAGDISNAFLQIPPTIQPATDSLANAVGITDTWQKTLDTMSSQTYPLKLEVTADLSKLSSIIRDIVRSEQGATTRANGGVPAGVDPRRGGRTS